MKILRPSRHTHKKRLAEQCKRFGFYQAPFFCWITCSHITMHGFILAALYSQWIDRNPCFDERLLQDHWNEPTDAARRKNAICHRMSAIKMNRRLLKLNFRSVCSSLLIVFSSQFVYTCRKSNILVLVYHSYKMRSANYLLFLFQVSYRFFK